MTFIQASSIVIGSALLAAWWLSRYDARIVGDARGWDVVRRILRCLLTAAMVEAIFWCGWRFFREGDTASGLMPIPIILVLAIFWAGSVGEIFSRGFSKLFDSDGGRAFDPAKGEAGLRQLSQLVQEGRQDEALKLSEKLKKTGDTNIIVLEAMVQRLGLENHADRQKSLAAARKLHSEGRFVEAERVLTGLLKRHPDHTEASVLLVRIYAQNLGEAGKAAAVYEAMQEQPGTSPGMIEFARTLIADAESTAPKPATSSKPPAESVDDLIAQKRFGTAITALQSRLKEQPEDFEGWLKLAEVNGRHCGSMQQVENIIKLLAADRNFKPEQVQLLRDRLQEWRAEWKLAQAPAKVAETAPMSVK